MAGLKITPRIVGLVLCGLLVCGMAVWGALARHFSSFRFGSDKHLAISIERRDERDEGYSAIKGLFRQYELIYLVADERDVIRVRTNIRGDPPEDVYLYRLQGSSENARRLLLAYLREINALHEQRRLDTRLPFSEFERRSQVNAAARSADDAADFSRRIRVGLPKAGQLAASQRQ